MRRRFEVQGEIVGLLIWMITTCSVDKDYTIIVRLPQQDK